jgi:hypothetical protein
MWRQFRTVFARTQPVFDLGSEFRYLPCGVPQHSAQSFIILLFPHPTTERFNEWKVWCSRFILVTAASKNHSAIECGLHGYLSR